MITHKQNEGFRETAYEYWPNEDGIWDVKHGEVCVLSLPMISGLIRQALFEVEKHIRILIRLA